MKNKIMLSEINNNKDIKILNSINSPATHCPMHTSLAFFTKLKGVSTLVVGTNECTHYSRMVVGGENNKSEDLHYTFLMDSKDVVFGCREKIVDSIEEMISEGAKKILILMTCVPSLIGEDYDNILDEIDYIDAKVEVIDVAHFKRNGYIAGYHLTMDKIGSFLDLQNTNDEINIWIKEESAEVNKIISILEKEYKVNVITEDMHIDDIEKSSGSFLNIICSYKFHGITKFFKENNIKCVELFDVYDRDTLSERYAELADICNIENEFLQENNSLKANSEPIAITLSDSVSLSLAYALNDYGFDIQLIHIEEFDDMQKYWQEKLLEKTDAQVAFIGNKKIDYINIGADFFDNNGVFNRMWILEFENKIGYEKIEFLENELIRLNLLEVENAFN